MAKKGSGRVKRQTKAPRKSAKQVFPKGKPSGTSMTKAKPRATGGGRKDEGF